MLALAVLAAGHGAQAQSDLSGTWKRNCAERFGLQIDRVAESLYAIRFCGLRRCSADEEWTPKSTILGDPRYKLVSPSELGVRRTDDQTQYFFYRRCPLESEWQRRSEVR
ncbi:hypothetical protein XH89_26705 [Bradyrhizobium sp. CCBAU 53340]|nr:hypothetical protein XH89_26705 [Bradyrhizobium sp. CCBAU 53340]